MPIFKWRSGMIGAEVCVAAPFTIAVDGTLNLADPLLDGEDSVGHRHFRIVVDVDAEGNGDLLVTWLTMD